MPALSSFGLAVQSDVDDALESVFFLLTLLAGMLFFEWWRLETSDIIFRDKGSN
jgi:hypothetical protein